MTEADNQQFVNPALQNVAAHMLELGLNSLAHAHHLIFSPIHLSGYDYYKDELAILQAAHAAEILGKAAIAEQHPLLIFTQLPGYKNDEEALLDIESLFESGRTITYREIPNRLWAVTGYKIKELELYKEVGRLRNSIQHFASIKQDLFLRHKTLQFIYGVIDPLINDFWGRYAVNCVEEGLRSDEHKGLFRSLLFWEIKYLVPEEFQDYYEVAKEWEAKLPHYGTSLIKDED